MVSAAGLALLYWLAPREYEPPAAREVGTRTQPAFLGRVRTRDFVAELRSALAGRSSFVAVRLVRTYTKSQDIQRSFLGLTSEATVVIVYSVEYAVGFDLRRLEIDRAQGGLVVTVDRPGLVATPAVRLHSHDVPDRGLLVGEEAALVELQAGVLPYVERQAARLEGEPEVAARAEAEFLRFLSGVLASRGDAAPAIRLSYR
ncbi:hypothetical protein [Sphingomonas sp.]|uniref:hypothetical protein n=1 Tax=Sphingomonas sp. TaxID=28214 RepID=UPI00180AAB9E|nr:hypothetical protein [Sphingomonas sp.]MBA3510453.1 hypothetical protein [Sphingomonas sp.]